MHLCIFAILWNVLFGCSHGTSNSFVFFFGNVKSDEYICLDKIDISSSFPASPLTLSAIDLVPAQTNKTYIERLYDQVTMQPPVALIASPDQLALLPTYPVPQFVILLLSNNTGEGKGLDSFVSQGKTVNIFAFYDHDRMKLIHFQQQTEDAKFVLLEDDSSYGIIFGFLLIILCASSSIILALLTVLASTKQLHEKITAKHPAAAITKLSMILTTLLLLVLLSSMLVLFYYFYNILVYVSISMIAICSVVAMHSIISFWLRRIRDYKLPIAFRWRDSLCSYQISLVSICVFPFALAFVILWLCYRNDPNIGYKLHSVIGIFLIAYSMPQTIPVSSLLLITVIYSGVVCYDVFMVFITPYLLPEQSTNSSDLPLSRHARSTVESIMSSVATGSAGTNGELLPIAFRVAYNDPFRFCETFSRSNLLGFGDVLIPGCLIVFVALYDTLWKVPYRRTLVSALLGYLVGSIVTIAVLFYSAKGQPALLYLCPCTLLPVLLVTLLFGGLSEFKRLQRGIFPPLPLSLTDSANKFEQPDNMCIIDEQLSQPSDHNIKDIVNVKT